MRALIRNLMIVIAVLAVCLWSINPPDKKLRLGKDLQGGVSLVYSVQIKPGDPPDVVERVIDVLKQRVDPNGILEVSITKQGRDRVEITMPLPGEHVKQLRRAYDAELEKLAATALDTTLFERLMRSEGAARDAEISRITGGNPARAEALRKAAGLSDAARAARSALNQAQADLKTATEAGADAARLSELTKAVDELVTKTADSELAYQNQRASVLASAINANDVRRALELSNAGRSLMDSTTKQMVKLPSPRTDALARLRKQYTDFVPQIDAVVAAYERYAAERTQLDDSADLKRLLAGAGVLDFRITVDPGEHPQESRLRRELQERGPQNVQSSDARWYKINKIDTWMDSTDDAAALEAAPDVYFTRYGLTAEAYKGEYYALCWDVSGSRLTKAEGDWSVAAAYQSTDPQSGLPAISFEMNNRGATLLNELTKQHVGKHMAVLLDDQVYTAPTLRSKIGRSGQITGSFNDAELRYIIRVLAAGSLQAKLSATPISENSLGPELGADNLRAGMRAGIVCFIAVTVFMIGYYFACGLIAVFALAVSLLVILGIMALNHAAFTMPGIAGIILTFGQAVDSNVLIYERMREEFRRGADMATAVRLGFSKAFSSIVDGNVANLIVCVVLYYVGTQEIKGFAITLGIGVLATLFSALLVSRLIFTILVDYVGWRRTSMLPMAIPGWQEMLTPRIDWLRLRWPFIITSTLFMILGLGVAFHRGSAMLDTEFRGGTQVELQFKTDPATGAQLTMTRQQVLDAVREIAKGTAPGDELKVLEEAEVLPVNPRDDGVTSDRFKIRTAHADEKVILARLVQQFSDKLDSRAALGFAKRNVTAWRDAPVYPVLSGVLGEDIDRPAVRDDVSGFVGGGVIVLSEISPPASKADLVSRLERMRQQPEYSDTLNRNWEVRVLEGTDQAATTAVLLVRDDAISPFDDMDRWGAEVGAREWRLALDALTRTTQLASVQTFSPVIAATFKAQAVVAIVLSMLLLTIYVWLRFGAARWALAATLPLFHDVLIIIGLVAIAQWMYETPATSSFAVKFGLLPFKIDLNMIAALLTIAGYSLNDTIIILDRIRENKGKMAFASAKQVNDSINQTISRTLITSGTTLISTVILFIYGGEAVRGFAYAFTLGVFIGTYSSIAISAPLVWSRKADRKGGDAPPGPLQSGEGLPSPALIGT